MRRAQAPLRGVHPVRLVESGPVLVVGAGAIGTLVAVRLAAAGHEVVLVARDRAGALRLEAGLTAVAPDGTETQARMQVVWRPGDLAVRPRLLVLATKCADAAAALAAWLPSLDEEAPVVAMQNGVMGDQLKALANERLVECTVSFPATLEAPGRSVQTGPGGLHVGPWPHAAPRDDPKEFKAVARLLADVAPVAGSGNMQGVKWTKLAINSCITSLGVLTGLELGDLLRDERARRAFLAIVEEAHAAGRADGVRFEVVNGFRPGLFAARWPGRGALVALIARRYRRHRSSSLQSLERGRKTEVDWLNGHIVATARRHGMPAPVNAALVDLIHAIEQGKRTPDAANLSELPS